MSFLIYAKGGKLNECDLALGFELPSGHVFGDSGGVSSEYDDGPTTDDVVHPCMSFNLNEVFGAKVDSLRLDGNDVRVGDVNWSGSPQGLEP